MAESQNESFSTTPPNHPTFKVHASDQDILDILNYALPNATLLSSSPLPHGQSYNNRIYNLTINVTDPKQQQASTQSLILKVGGRFATSIKIVNEVMCLKLVKHHCPSLVVPRVVAYSSQNGQLPGVEFRWILMTKISGTTLHSVSMSLSDQESIAADLANFVKAIRTIASPGAIGNLANVNEDGVVTLSPLVDSPKTNGWPFESYIKYKQSIMNQSIEDLAHCVTFEPNRSYLPQLRLFVQHHLANLPMMTDSKLSSSVMTHYHLSDRNILVDPNTTPLRISGIVDWEYSGFFSPFDEYLLASEEIFASDNAADGNTPSFATQFLANLERLDISTPKSGSLEKHWENARILNKLHENIAPWWLRNLHGEQLEMGLDEASCIVHDCLRLFGIKCSL